MAMSYKPVMLLAVLDHVNANGRAKLADVVRAFRKFYEKREQAGLVVEQLKATMARVGELDDAEVRRTMLANAFEKFERREYLKYDRDLAYVRFGPALWRQFKGEDLDRLRSVCRQSITEYYERIGKS